MGQGPRAGFLTASMARYEAFGSVLDGCRVRSSLAGYEAFGREFDGCRVWELQIAKVD